MAFRIQLDNVGKKFDAFHALRGFSETVSDGDRISLLGHNGAGKSTLLNLLATLSPPSSGKISYEVDGKAVDKKPQIRDMLTYLSHEPMLYPDLTGLENLNFVARLHGIRITDEELTALLDKVGMRTARNRLFRTCSRGMQQRLSIARALLPQPQLLLLDEPFSGLDSEGIARFTELFHASDLSWLLVTHDLELAWQMANRFWILKRGKLIHSVRRDDLEHDDYLGLAREATMAGVTR
ncbi:MAG: ABC transporter ATP-binding protein [Acidobacteriota bacterium]|nr:ABC transporter ATP-binding protein [Acidobacteriota bacterium]